MVLILGAYFLILVGPHRAINSQGSSGLDLFLIEYSSNIFVFFVKESYITPWDMSVDWKFSGSSTVMGAANDSGYCHC